MTDHSRRAPLESWLTDLPDAALIRLLRLRPDLAQPPPGSVAALAARAQARQSVRAATDELDFLRLAVIDALLVLQTDNAGIPVGKLLALVGERAPEAAVTAALDDLRDRALCWGDDVVRVAAESGCGLPWSPGQVTLEDVSRSPAEVSALLAGLGPAQRELLDKLVIGSPVGRTRDAAPGTPPDRPVPRLLAAGLLRQLDDETVILPRIVGQLLRGEQPGPTQLVAPDPTVSTTEPADVDAAAAGAVIDLLRQLDTVLAALGRSPAPELRSGGLGIREVKRLAKVTDLDETRLGLLLEVAHAAGLIAAGDPEPELLDDRYLDGPYWAPTVTADRFAEKAAADRWHLLAGAWLGLTARPGLIGRHGPDGKARAALSPSLFSTAAPLDRRLLLAVLAELPAGAGVDSAAASRALIWQRPRWAARLAPEPVAELLAEAQALGLLGRGALSSPARALIDEHEGADGAVAAMTRVLPKPVDHFLVQADLTVVVPGPLDRELADELATVATVESAGAAMVYRVSEPTIRHALDVGRTGDALHRFFEKHSKTPIPQGLTYLIDDVARRHGQLRVGIAGSFVRCEDPALLAQAVAVPAAEQLGMRALAPTVAVAQAPIADVLAALRGAGFVPAAEDSAGMIVDIRPRGARVPAPARLRPPATGPSDESLRAVVDVLRRAGTALSGATRVDPFVATAALQHAALSGTPVLIGYLDPAGVASQRLVSPISVRGGRLVAFDTAADRLRDLAIHRITSVERVDTEGDSPMTDR